MQIPLWRGGRWHGEVVAYTEVDAVDFEALNQHRWFLTDEGYAARCTPRPARKTVLMARQLLCLAHGAPSTADHIDRNPLNNTRANLRVIPARSQAQNRVHTVHSTGAALTSMYRGVSRAASGRWKAKVRNTHLGTFDTELEAAEAARDGRAAYMPLAVD